MNVVLDAADAAWAKLKRAWPWVVGTFAALAVFGYALLSRRPARDRTLETVEALVRPRLKQVKAALRKARQEESQNQDKIDALIDEVYAAEHDAAKRLVGTGHVTQEEAVARLRALVPRG